MSETKANQNAIFRLANLPVVSSAYARVSVCYCETKDNHPYIKSVFELVETGVKTITSVAYDSAAPFIIKLEPQISIVNELACKSLDKLESVWPVLHQLPEQIVLSAKGVISEAKATVAIIVDGANDCVLCPITEAVGSMTRWLTADGGVNAVHLRRVIRLASEGLDSALSMSQLLVDQALPPTDEEMEEEVKILKGFEVPASSPSYSVRVVTLTSTLCRRAYHQARCFTVRHPEHFSLHQHAEETDQPGALAEPTSHVQVKETEIVFHGPPRPMQTSWLILDWDLCVVPRLLQQQVLCALLCASEIFNNFSSAREDGSAGSVEAALDYLVHNTPLGWLVGPLYPRSPPAPPRGKPSCRMRKRPSKRGSGFDSGCSATLYQRY